MTHDGNIEIARKNVGRSSQTYCRPHVSIRPKGVAVAALLRLDVIEYYLLMHADAVRCSDDPLPFLCE